MKVTINIDCTPSEAREMLGLPDVRELQQDWVRQVGEKMQASAQNFSPEALVQSWASGAAGGDWLKAMMAGVATPAQGG